MGGRRGEDRRYVALAWVVNDDDSGWADWIAADDVLVTKDGYENLTTAPKGIEEMERIIKGGE